MSYAACCWTTEHINTNTTIDFYHKDLQTLRQVNSQGILPTNYCSACLEQEKTDKKSSMRMGYLETHGAPTYTPSLQYLDINIDYACNLACVTCGPELSTTWRNELKIVNNDIRPRLDEFLKNLDSIDFSDLKEIRLWGGEPLLTRTHVTILEHVLRQGRADQVRLMYNTNGTCRISDDVKRLIEQFKFARISFSIDGIGDRFEYLRYPAKWSEVRDNLIWWKNNLPHNSMLSLTVTASLLNVLYLDEVYQWHADNFAQSCHGDPIEIYVHQAFGAYELEYMPIPMVEYFRSLQGYCQPWLQDLDILGSKSDQINRIVHSLRELDTRRGQDFASLFLQTAKFIGYNQ